MKNKFYTLLIFSLTLSLDIYAQIDTDRPAFTNSVNVVPKKSLQIETGLNYDWTKVPRSVYSSQFDPPLVIQSFVFPSANLRYGLSESTEARLFLPNFVYQNFSFPDDDSTVVSSNFSIPLVIGLKQRIYNGDKLKLSSMITLVGYGTGRVETPRRFWVETSVDLIWSYQLTDKLRSAGTFILRPELDGNYINGAALVGYQITPNFWMQGEYVYRIFNQYDRDWGRSTGTINLSAQKNITDYNAVDLTVGSTLFGYLFWNYSIQLGYAHLINANKK